MCSVSIYKGLHPGCADPKTLETNADQSLRDGEVFATNLKAPLVLRKRLWICGSVATVLTSFSQITVFGCAIGCQQVTPNSQYKYKLINK